MSLQIDHVSINALDPQESVDLSKETIAHAIAAAAIALIPTRTTFPPA